MIGPVYWLEWLLGSRRGKLELVCRLYAGWLLLQFMVLLPNLDNIDVHRQVPGHVAVGRFINSYLETLVSQHFLLLILATPTFVAGAVADEKSRRTMDYLLTADLTAWEIIIGKLLGRLAQVAVLSLTALPFFCAVAGYAAFPPLTIVVLAVLTLVPCFGVGALSILASVWSRQTRDAVLRVYAWLVVGAIGLGALHEFTQDHVVVPAAAGATGTLDWLIPLDDVLLCLNPVHVLEPAWKSQHMGVLAWRALASMLAWGSIGALALALAVWRLRPAYRKELEKPVRASSFLMKHASCGADPIAWREREVEGLALIPWLRRVPRWLGMLAILTAAAVLLIVHFDEIFDPQWPPRPSRSFWAMSMASLGLVFIPVVVGARASGAICTERDRHTWELIMLTPLTSRTIVRQKLWGVMHAGAGYFAIYACALILIALAFGHIEEVIGVVVLLVFTWMLSYLMAANGLAWSAKSTSAWRSLLSTLVSGYLYILAIYFGSSLALSVGCCFVGAIAAASRLPTIVTVSMLLFLVCVIEAVLFYYVARQRLGVAVRWIADHDRGGRLDDEQPTKKK